MEASFEIEPDLFVLPALLPVPTIGILPVNAFLVKGPEPFLVDTGMLADGEAFLRTFASLIDSADLRWIYLTHTDPDHIGALMALLDRAPRAKVVTTFVGLAKLQIGLRPLSPDRVLLRNPGEQLELSDRTLSILRPPIFDAPETTMVHDSRLDALFSSDAFGGPLSEPVVLANELDDEALQRTQLTWATIDAPWIHHVDRQLFSARVGEIVDLDPKWIFSSHLPPARRMAESMCKNLCRAPDAAPWASPDQTAFEAILRAAAAPPAV